MQNVQRLTETASDGEAEELQQMLRAQYLLQLLESSIETEEYGG